MYFWYKFFTYLFYPFAPFYLYFRKLRKKEDFIRYKEKLSKINISRDNGFLIWFHVASVGEAMSILPLIYACIEEKQINKILITSITLSSGKILEKKFLTKNEIQKAKKISIRKKDVLLAEIKDGGQSIVKKKKTWSRCVYARYDRRH